MNKRQIIQFLAARIKNHPKLVRLFQNIARHTSPLTTIILDYPVNSKRRWDSRRPHQGVYDIINQNRDIYRNYLKSFLDFVEDFLRIPKHVPNDSSSMNKPHWTNAYTPALDGVALYGLIAINKPKYYLEVGSGNSTKFAHQAITDHKLDTRIISIDPCPRDEIDSICDEIIREPVENIDVGIFDQLSSNDILYVDSSHRVFMNSDATTIFLDVIPRLKPGVFVEIHDVFLPFDYPSRWIDRYYSEQYLLAAYLVSKGNRFDIVLANAFISSDDELKNILSPLWQEDEMQGVDTRGCSFWTRTK